MAIEQLFNQMIEYNTREIKHVKKIIQENVLLCQTSLIENEIFD